jgi:hypothetical protein
VASNTEEARKGVSDLVKGYLDMTLSFRLYIYTRKEPSSKIHFHKKS